MSPRTDLCDTCQHFRDGLHYNACQEEEAKELLQNTSNSAVIFGFHSRSDINEFHINYFYIGVVLYIYQLR